MKIPVAPETSGSWRSYSRYLPWLAVLAILLLTAGIRVRLLDVPLERDEGEYAYVGQLIMQGIPPYEQAYNMKLPGTYYAYAAGMAIFGQTAAGVHLTLLVANGLTSVFLFWFGRRLAGQMAGWVAAGSYALMSVSPAVLGLAAHATQFVACFAVPGAWLLWEALATGRRGTFFFSGLLFGVAFLMKQPGICFGGFAVAMVVWHAKHRGSLGSREFWQALGILIAGLALPFILLCAVTALAGDFSRFWFWTVQYARSYASQRSLAEGATALAAAMGSQLWPFGGFWLLAIAGGWAWIQGGARRWELGFMLAFLAFAGLATTPGLYFRNHYFVVLLPAFALFLGLGLEQWRTRLASRQLAWVPAAAFLLVAAGSVCLQRQIFFQQSPTQVSQDIYHGNPFVESVQIGQLIRENSAPEARVAVIGSEPQLYFYAQRRAATGYLYTYPLVENQPYASRMQREMITEIEKAKPEFLVVLTYDLSWLMRPTSDPTIFKVMKEYTRRFYQPVAAVGRGPQVPAAWAGDGITNAPPTMPQEAMILYQRKEEKSPPPRQAPGSSPGQGAFRL